jgi:ABC-type lipoprotein release transport system permease subunit
VRLSLGASARQIKTLVLRDGARPVIDGLILGLWGGVAGRILIRSYTDLEVTVLDPWMLAVSPAPIVLVALFACYWPAARAARVDPTTALRYE